METGTRKQKIIALRPIREKPADWDEVEERIRVLFLKLLYRPIVEIINEPIRLTNAKRSATDESALSEAIRLGRVQFYRGTFSGKFGSAISKELKKIGAVWDNRSKTYKLALSDVPYDVRAAISGSFVQFQRKVDAIDDQLAKILPAQFSEELKVSKLFDTVLWKTDREFRASVSAIGITPELPPEQRKKIADEWQTNLQLWIKDFTEKEILKLRTDIQKSVFAGNRRETMVAAIQKSYGVTLRKAKFLARQETSLLMTKFKETRYVAAGVNEYKWQSVAGSKLHPVRPRHKELDAASKKGKIFRWDQPPITTAPGEPERRNNPGQDYNCRCSAIPIVRF